MQTSSCVLRPGFRRLRGLQPGSANSGTELAPTHRWPRKKKFDFSDIAADRKKANLNQLDCWDRYGVTQSGGSYYESGRNLPKPLATLLWLHRSGKVTDEDQADALN